MSRFFKILFFSAASVFLFFFLLGRIPLWSSDEGRYGEIAREAFESGDFLVTQFNYIDYLEKPVLAPLLTAGAYALFGVSSFSARLVSVVSALLGIFLCWFFSRRHFGQRIADLSAVILLTSVGYVLVGRFAVIDMLMTLLMSGAMFCLMSAYFERKPKIYLLAYVFMGFAFLTKGLIGFALPGAIFFFFLVWVGDLKEIFKMKLGWGILILAVMVVPWFWAVSSREPEFFDVFIIKHHLERFAAKTFGRKKPFWFYVPILFATLFPWSLFLISAVLRAVKEPESDLRRKLKFMMVWAAVIFVFFSLPRAKLPYYLLPLSMPAAVLLAYFFEAWRSGRLTSLSLEHRLAEGAWRVVTVLCVMLFFVLNPVLYFFFPDPEMAALRPIVITGTSLVMTGSIGVFILFLRGHLLKAVCGLGSLVYLVLIFAILGMKIISPYQSTYSLAKGIKPLLRDSDRVAIYASPDDYSDFMFHLQRRVIVAGGDRGTLTAESSEPDHLEESALWFLDAEEIITEFNAGKDRFYILLDQDKLAELRALNLGPYRIIQQYGGKKVITNDLSVPLEKSLPLK